MLAQRTRAASASSGVEQRLAASDRPLVLAVIGVEASGLLSVLYEGAAVASTQGDKRLGCHAVTCAGKISGAPATVAQCSNSRSIRGLAQRPRIMAVSASVPSISMP